MTAASIRQEVIANNVANVNTPGFRKKDVEFEDLLAREIYGEKKVEGKLELVQTHINHLPFKPRSIHAEPTLVEDNSTIMRVDKNNVDVDVEMATLAKNQIYYNTLANQMGGYISKLRNAITSGQS